MLGDFARIADHHGLTYVVIGAGARVLLCERTNQDPGRVTTDWDLAVLVKDWKVFHSLIDDLSNSTEAAFRATGVEHRLVHKNTGIHLDVVPFGGVESPKGRITWPSGQEMDVQGIEFVLESSEEAQIGTSQIRFASLTSQAQQKAATYLDRREQGVTHDLIDFVWVMKNYAGAGNEDRIYDEAIETITANDIDHVAWGACLLGMDLRVCAPQILEPTRRTLTELLTPGSRAIEHLRPRSAPDYGERAVREIRQMAEAVLFGLDAK